LPLRCEYPNGLRLKRDERSVNEAPGAPSATLRLDSTLIVCTLSATERTAEPVVLTVHCNPVLLWVAAPAAEPCPPALTVPQLVNSASHHYSHGTDAHPKSFQIAIFLSSSKLCCYTWQIKSYFKSILSTIHSSPAFNLIRPHKIYYKPG
jgi:hypothetical protein